MNLTEVKLKALILESVEETLPEMITGLLDTNDPENVVQAIELMNTMGDPSFEGISATTHGGWGDLTISGDSISQIFGVIKKFGLNWGHGGHEGADGRPFVTVNMSDDGIVGIVDEGYDEDEEGLTPQELDKLLTLLKSSDENRQEQGLDLAGMLVPEELELAEQQAGRLDKLSDDCYNKDGGYDDNKESCKEMWIAFRERDKEIEEQVWEMYKEMFYAFAADGVGGKIRDPEHLAVFQQFYGPNGLKWKKLEEIYYEQRKKDSTTQSLVDVDDAIWEELDRWGKRTFKYWWAIRDTKRYTFFQNEVSKLRRGNVATTLAAILEREE